MFANEDDFTKIVFECTIQRRVKDNHRRNDITTTLQKTTVVVHASFKVMWTHSLTESPSCPQSLTPFLCIVVVPTLSSQSPSVTDNRMSLPCRPIPLLNYSNFLPTTIVVQGLCESFILASNSLASWDTRCWMLL